jgi:acetyl/propionyl-CoA carboxylase alpha subunit
VRVDTGIHEGTRIEPHYDPLLAKVIVWGETRDQARARMRGALEETVLLGLPTNQSFLLDILASDFFAAADTFTTTIESMTWPPPEYPEYMALAAKQAHEFRGGSAASGGRVDRHSPWHSLGAFRMGR